MASEADLKKEIHEILKDADLSVTSAKKVRLQLQVKLNCNLLPQKFEIDKIVMDFVNSVCKEDDPDSDASDAEKESKNSDDDSDKELERTRAESKRKHNDGASSEEGVKRSRKSASGKTRGTKRSQKKVAVADDGKPKVKRSNNGFTRACQLSPELAKLMGAEALPRHEVVKKMWSMIKERNLYDPKNKQYAICDDELLKVMGVKRFRTFGMLKYLKRHLKQGV